MPRFNARGDYCSGYGGDGHVLSLNGHQIFPAPSAAGGWITDDEIISGTWTGWHDIRTIAVPRDSTLEHPKERVLYRGEANGVVCGGGRWATRPKGEPWLLDDGSRSALPMEHFGSRDGCLVTWATDGGGLIIAGRVIVPSDISQWPHGPVNHCAGVQVFDRDTALWQRDGRLETLGMPVPMTLPGRVMNHRAFQHKGAWWLVYQSEFNGQLVVHPFDSLVGYALTRPFLERDPETHAYRPDAISIDGEMRVVWSTVESEMPWQVRYLAQPAFPPPVDLRGASPLPVEVPRIGRPLALGAFEFAGPWALASRNCRLPVVQGQPWLTVYRLDGLPLYRYTAGDPDGDPDAIDRAVEIARAVGDGLPVLAYVPRQAAAVRLPDAVVGVECYRRLGESVADYEAYIRATVARCARAVLITQSYTSNHTLTTDLRSIVPVVARVARDMQQVEGILVFSGSGRATGYQDHPEVHDAWQQLGAGIPQEVPVSEVYIGIIDYDRKVSRRDPKGMLVRFDVGSAHPITRVECRMEYDEPPIVVEFPVGRGSDGRYVRALAFKPVRTGAFHFVLTARDSSGAEGSARSPTPVNVTEDEPAPGPEPTPPPAGLWPPPEGAEDPVKGSRRVILRDASRPGHRWSTDEWRTFFQSLLVSYGLAGMPTSEEGFRRLRADLEAAGAAPQVRTDNIHVSGRIHLPRPMPPEAAALRERWPSLSETEREAIIREEHHPDHVAFNWDFQRNADITPDPWGSGTWIWNG